MLLKSKLILTPPLLCNLTMCEKYRKMFSDDNAGERFKMLLLFCQEEDAETRSAAAGAMATLTRYCPEYCSKIRGAANSWEESLRFGVDFCLLEFLSFGNLRFRAQKYNLLSIDHRLRSIFRHPSSSSSSLTKHFRKRHFYRRTLVQNHTQRNSHRYVQKYGNRLVARNFT